MDDKILESLNAEISRLIEKLGELEPGGQEYGNVKQDLVDMIDRREKMNATINAAKDLELKERKLDYDEVKDTDDTLQKEREEENRKKDHMFGYIFEGIKVAAVFGYCIFMGLEGFHFEKTGNLISQTFREGRNNGFKMLDRM